VPVIKVSTKSALAQQWHDLIDVNAGRILDGAATIEDIGRELFSLILDVASGRKKTCAQRHGIHNGLALFYPGPIV
jgi:galactarate dehydratase